MVITRALPVALALVVVLAGCAAPSGGPVGPATTGTTPAADTDREPTATATAGTRTTTNGPVAGTTTPAAGSGTDPGGRADRRVRVVNGSLPATLNATETFLRVLDLLSASARTPRVWVGDPTGTSRAEPPAPTGFRRVLGVGPPRPTDADAVAVGGLTNAIGTVYVLPRANASPGAIERTLAHEFVHVVQFGNGVPIALSARVDPSYRSTTDASTARRAVLEGAAVVGSDAYVERYLVGTETESAILRRAYQTASVGTKLFWAPYYYGQRFVRSRAPNATAFEVAYAGTPTTTEQLLDGDGPDGDPRVRLSVTTQFSGTDWERRSEDAMGELFLRVALQTELSRERSRRAGTGWGADRLLSVVDRNRTRQGYAWVLRWDDTGEAREFERAIRTFVDRRRAATADDVAFRVTTVGEETVVLFAGARAYVRNATVAGRDGFVWLGVGETATARAPASSRGAPAEGVGSVRGT